MRIDKPNDIRTAKGFLVLEGLNGAGKSTLQGRIAELCGQRGRKCCLTREPGGTEFGASVRSLVLTPRTQPLSDRTELFLFSADRSEHVSRLIQPALQRKELVLCDRYYYSSLAFQGYGRGFSPEVIEQISNVAIAETRPDLVILLDLDPEVGLRRTQQREATGGGAGVDTFEREALEFHKRVRAGFLSIADRAVEPFLVVDAGRGADEVFKAVLPYLDRWLAVSGAL